MNRFHFTFGPVQGFVAQARRTRDFWAGSFLLSYLVAHVMKNVESQGGKIFMPDVVGNKMLDRLNATSGQGPTIGSLPNCFEAVVPATFDGNAVIKAVQTEWRRIAEAVWNHDKLEAANMDKTLWDAQLGNFWEIAWVIAPAEETGALSMRKNWRNRYPPDQAGDKCSMMGEWQELSKVCTPHRKTQNAFWSKVREAAGLSQLELRDGERLCAISYVKRRFVHVWQELNPGWKLPTGVPSTSYMAAVRWVERAIQTATVQNLEAFHDAAKQLVEYGEWSSGAKIRCIENAANDKRGLSHRFSSLDGRVFFRSSLENENEFDAQKAQAALESLNALAATELESGRKLGHPSPFYAILLMDGDNLGATKRALGGDASQLSEALGKFCSRTPHIVDENNGFLVYAGGDDVLALLPLEDALQCALELREAYAKELTAAAGASISAAIIYAHMKLPLTLVLKDSHRLLDEVAKDEAGRDALAVRVWKPGGETLTWAKRWGEAGANVAALLELVNAFQKGEEGEPGYASKPLYRIRERLEMLAGGSSFDKEIVHKLLVAEYATSGVLSKVEPKNSIAEQRIAALLPLCEKPDGGYGAEAAMLLRFLAQKGMER